jgi:biopolymer transport protein ExbD
MNYLLEVCLVAVALTTSITTPVVAQSGTYAPPPLQKGVSVELPVTTNAIPLPDADREDASIVTVTNNGSVYFGIGLTTPARLAERIRDDLFNRTEKNLYIKADARVPYAGVAKVLDAVRVAGVEKAKLLTAQTDSSEAGTFLPPKGLEVLLSLPPASSPNAVVLQVLESGQQWPRLKINDKDVAWPALQGELKKLFQNGSERVALVKAEGSLPFADVVAVVDMSRSAGAKVALVPLGQ